jgi:uncharacterized protein YxjI
MKTFTVTQKILAIGPTYEVRDKSDGPVLFTVRGRILTFTPFLEMQKGKDGEKTHFLKGNFLKTRFIISTMQGSPVGEVQFPFFSFRKSFILTIGSAQYHANGSLFAWNFTAGDSSGRDVFVIQKEMALRDKFSVTAAEDLAFEPVILAAVAVDQRFFQQR